MAEPACVWCDIPDATPVLPQNPRCSVPQRTIPVSGQKGYLHRDRRGICANRCVGDMSPGKPAAKVVKRAMRHVFFGGQTGRFSGVRGNYRHAGDRVWRKWRYAQRDER